ncbi:unnamed protein product [Staurois parvus]|uniref:Uncharacterized protein n=1 Tax=Staurois parvus TaxID=386267 RepID=A0ABN9AFF6_9NEOB|nr:unnamed protein product [Staurois parvus]
MISDNKKHWHYTNDTGQEGVNMWAIKGLTVCCFTVCCVSVLYCKHTALYGSA